MSLPGGRDGAGGGEGSAGESAVDEERVARRIFRGNGTETRTLDTAVTCSSGTSRTPADKRMRKGTTVKNNTRNATTRNSRSIATLPEPASPAGRPPRRAE